MRKLIFPSLLMFTFLITYSQDERYYYFYTDAQLKANIDLNRHKSCQVLHLENSNFFLCTAIQFDGISPNVFDCISIGTVKSINNVFYCFDKNLNRTYKFKQIDFYTLEALNHTAVFVKGTKLYLQLGSVSGTGFRAFFQNSDLIKSDYWKTGIKNGIHMYWYDENIEKLYYYQNNIIKDSITLSNCDSTYTEKKFKFIKKYMGNAYDVTE